MISIKVSGEICEESHPPPKVLCRLTLSPPRRADRLAEDLVRVGRRVLRREGQRRRERAARRVEGPGDLDKQR